MNRWQFKLGIVLLVMMLFVSACGGSSSTGSNQSGQSNNSSGSSSSNSSASNSSNSSKSQGSTNASTTNDQGAQAQTGGTITITSGTQDMSEADPALARNIGSISVADILSEPLVRYGNGKYQPVLAKSWDVSNDGKTYTFHLRQGVKYSDGNTMTAQDVVANWKRVTDKSNPLPDASNLVNVTNMKALDANTVEVDIKALNPDFLSKLTQFWILDPKSWAKKDQNNGIVAGTGPFYVAQRQPGTKMVLKANKNYWGGTPKLDSINVLYVPDANTQVVDLKSGTLDLVQFGAFTDADQLKQQGYQVLPFGQVNWARVTFNLKTVNNQDLRKAMCYAIDFNAVLKNAYYGYGSVMKSLVYPGTWLDTGQTAYYPYDVAKAKQILDQAGIKDTNGDGYRELNGKDINLSFPTRTGLGWDTTTQMMQSMFKAIGIKTTISTAPTSTYYSNVRTGKYDVTWWLSNGNPEPPIAAGDLLSTQYWDVAQKAVPQIDKDINNAQSTLDKQQRIKDYNDLQKVYHNMAMECDGIWLKQVDFAAPNVHGIKVNAQGVIYDAANWYVSSN